MLLIILFSLLICASQATNSNENFGIENTTANFSDLLEPNGNFRNVESVTNTQLIIENSDLRDSDVKKRIVALENMSNLFCKHNLLDIQHENFQIFLRVLNENIEAFSEHFNTSKLDFIIKIILSSVTHDNYSDTRRAISKLIPLLSSSQRENILDNYKKFIKFDIVLIGDEINFEDFLTPELVAHFLDEYMGLFFNFYKRNNDPIPYIPITLILISISKSRINVSDATYEILFECLGRVSKPATMTEPSVDSLFDALGLIYNNLKPIAKEEKEYSKFSKIITDLILSINISGMLDPDVQNSSFVKLMCVCNDDHHYLREKIKKLPDNHPIYSQNYVKIQIQHQIGKVSMCHLIILNYRPYEENLKSGRGAIKSLQLIYSDDPEVLKLLYDDFKHFYECVLRIKKISRSNFDILSTIITINAKVAFLVFNTFPDLKNLAARLISFGIGYFSTQFSKELIEDVKPILEDVINFLLQNLDQSYSFFMGEKTMEYDMRFIALHPSELFIKYAKNQYYQKLLLKNPVKLRLYNYIKNIKDSDISNLELILQKGFLNYLEDYQNNPNDSDIVHFKDYFDLIRSLKVMSRTEENIILMFFDNFNLNI